MGDSGAKRMSKASNLQSARKEGISKLFTSALTRAGQGSEARTGMRRGQAGQQLHLRPAECHGQCHKALSSVLRGVLRSRATHRRMAADPREWYLRVRGCNNIMRDGGPRV